MKNETAPPPGEGVHVTYRGRSSNHYIISPSRKIRHYGYGNHGKKLYVFLEDARLAPDLFVLDNAEDEKKVWPDDPQDVPEKLRDKMLVSAAPEAHPENLERVVEVEPDDELEEEDEAEDEEEVAQLPVPSTPKSIPKSTRGRRKTAKRK